MTTGVLRNFPVSPDRSVRCLRPLCGCRAALQGTAPRHRPARPLPSGLTHPGTGQAAARRSNAWELLQSHLSASATSWALPFFSPLPFLAFQCSHHQAVSNWRCRGRPPALPHAWLCSKPEGYRHGAFPQPSRTPTSNSWDESASQLGNAVLKGCLLLPLLEGRFVW